MPFIGNQPSAVPLTSADITDGIITNADISSTAGITLNKISGNPNFRNRIINGDMSINQRNATINNQNSADTYVVDRFAIYGAEASKMSGQQSTTAPTYFKNSFLITSLAATTPPNNYAYGFRQIIEGSNIADLSWGSASAKTVTISFWVRSSITGTYAFALFNSAVNRSYVKTYTINSANTFEYKTITIDGDTAGTWLTTNGQGIHVWWDLGSNSSFNETAGSWVGSLKVRTSGSSNWIGTSGATFYITGVQLEAGTSATDFEFLPIDVDLARCQRYYYNHVNGNGQTIGVASYFSTTQIEIPISFPVSMRAAPSAISVTGTDYYYLSKGSPIGADYFNSIVDIFASQKNGAMIYNNDAGQISGTQGQAYVAYTNNAGSFISFSAEL